MGQYDEYVAIVSFLPGEYYVRDWNFDASQLPSILPVGRYSLKCVWRIDENESLLNFTIYFNVANYGVLDLGMG